MKARIYQPSKSTMQSGRGKLDQWIVEIEPETAKEPESLMGWTASGDTLNQVKIKFKTIEEAENYAKNEGLDYTLLKPRARKVKPRNYGDNFKYTPPSKTTPKEKKKKEKTKPKKAGSKK